MMGVKSETSLQSSELLVRIHGHSLRAGRWQMPLYAGKRISIGVDLSKILISIISIPEVPQLSGRRAHRRGCERVSFYNCSFEMPVTNRQPIKIGAWRVCVNKELLGKHQKIMRTLTLY